MTTDTTDNQAAGVRVVIREGAPWFVAVDLARLLGYRDAEQACGYVEDDEKAYTSLRRPDGDQQALIVSESGMYRLCFFSRNPPASADEIARIAALTAMSVASTSRHMGLIFLIERVNWSLWDRSEETTDRDAPAPNRQLN